jgi:hypothetical protein
LEYFCGVAIVFTHTCSRTGTSVHLPSPRKPVTLYCHSKGWRSAGKVALLRTHHDTPTKNFARSLILDDHGKRQPHFDRGLWTQDTFSSKQNSGAANILRLPFEPYPAAGLAITDRDVNWETLSATRSFRCPFRHCVEAHSVCETEKLFRLPASLPSANRLPYPRDPLSNKGKHAPRQPCQVARYLACHSAKREAPSQEKSTKKPNVMWPLKVRSLYVGVNKWGKPLLCGGLGLRCCRGPATPCSETRIRCTAA